MIRNLYKLLMGAAVAQSKWEQNVTQRILKDKRKLLLLGLMLIPIFVVSVADARTLPTILGGKKAYAPVFSTMTVFGISGFIGLIAGLITGVIGAGGGFVITPALMSFDIRGIFAVGTGLFHIFAKAIMGTVIHKKLGNVCMKLAIAFVIGSLVGATLGGTINRALYNINPIISDTFISVVYVLLLGILCFYALHDFFKLRKKAKTKIETINKEISEDEEKGITATTGFAKKLQLVNIPPVITFDEEIVLGGRKISAIFVSGCGFIVGFFAAIMGVGGGFLTFPMFVYILGVSSFTTVGTDIFQIIITAGYTSITQYAIYGFVFYTLAMGLLVGSLIGIQLGALTTKVIKGLYIRGFYAIAIIAGFLNRLLSLPSKFKALGIIDISSLLAENIRLFGVIIFFILLGIFAIWTLFKFIINIKILKET